MTVFVIAAVLITLLILGFALWPLGQKMPKIACGLLIALGVCAFALYRLVGTPEALQTYATQTPASLDEAITLLQEQLEHEPQVAEGWQLLGRAFASQGKTEQARDAFARAAALLPDDATALLEAAQARSLADPNHFFDDQAIAMLQHGLQVQPTQQRIRWLLGIAQRQRNLPAQAAATWEPLLNQVDANVAVSLLEQINAARKEAGQPPLPNLPIQAIASDTLHVQVTLDANFSTAASLPNDAAVFVIARIPNGPPMPVAVQKHILQNLPLNITLSDADSPMPTQKLSTLPEVELIARISRNGNAQRGEGDLESAPVRVTLPTQATINLVIDGPR